MLSAADRIVRFPEAWHLPGEGVRRCGLGRSPYGSTDTPCPPGDTPRHRRPLKMQSARATGGKVDDVVKVTIFVVDIRTNTQVWKARSEAFSGGFPTSTLVEVRSPATPAPWSRSRRSPCSA